MDSIVSILECLKRVSVYSHIYVLSDMGPLQSKNYYRGCSPIWHRRFILFYFSIKILSEYKYISMVEIDGIKK